MAKSLEEELGIGRKIFGDCQQKALMSASSRFINYVRRSYKLDPVNIECSTNIFVIIMARAHCIMINVGQCIEWFVL